MTVRIMLFGEPGVGKGTLGAMLSTKFDAPRLSTGDLFRAEIAKGTPLGLQVKDIINAGHLVPDDIVLKVTKELFAHEYENGFIIDGVVRTIPQAEAFDAMLKAHGWSMDAIIRIKVDTEVIIRRLSARRQCENCGTAFNLVSSPPKVAWTCDKCGGRLVQRPDDEPHVVRERLKVYDEQTAAVIEYYRERGMLKQVDVDNLPAEESFKKLLAAIGR